MINREIKFRVWDNLSEAMYSIRVIDFLADGTIGNIRLIECKPDENGEFDFDFPIRRDGEYVLMQFTGLFDKNGVEIYEGDIVSIDFGMDEPEISEVKFTSGGFVVEADFGDYDMTTIGWAIDMSDSIEVIGNIYQHPELLK